MYTKQQLLEAIGYWSRILEQDTKERNTQNLSSKELQSLARKRIENNIKFKRSQRQPIINKINQIKELIPFASVPGQPKLVLINWRPVVLVDFGTIAIPMYCSTGLSGKSSKIANAGAWYMFLGLGDDYWFNKTSIIEDEISMNKQFGCQKCIQFAQKLNEEIGDIVGMFNNTSYDIKNGRIKNLVRHDVNKCFKFKPINGNQQHDPENVYRYLLNLMDAQLNTCSSTGTAFMTLMKLNSLGYKFKAEDLKIIGNRENQRTYFNDDMINIFASDAPKKTDVNGEDDDWFDEIMSQPDEKSKHNSSTNHMSISDIEDWLANRDPNLEETENFINSVLN